MVPAAVATTARQPRRTPSSAANGMASAWPPGKPTTSQGMAGPTAGLERQPRADRHGVDRPGDLDHQPAHADHAAVDLHAVEVGDLFGQRFHCGLAAREHGLTRRSRH